jgi:hypothetical protein
VVIAEGVHAAFAPVIEVHLRSTGAPLEWQVHPASNKWVPGAHGQVHFCISRFAWWGIPHSSWPGAIPNTCRLPAALRW